MDTRQRASRITSKLIELKTNRKLTLENQVIIKKITHLIRIRDQKVIIT